MTITGKSGLLLASTRPGSSSITDLASGMMSAHCETDTISSPQEQAGEDIAEQVENNVGHLAVTA